MDTEVEQVNVYMEHAYCPMCHQETQYVEPLPTTPVTYKHVCLCDGFTVYTCIYPRIFYRSYAREKHG